MVIYAITENNSVFEFEDKDKKVFFRQGQLFGQVISFDNDIKVGKEIKIRFLETDFYKNIIDIEEKSLVSTPIASVIVAASQVAFF